MTAWILLDRMVIMENTMAKYDKPLWTVLISILILTWVYVIYIIMTSP